MPFTITATRTTGPKIEKTFQKDESALAFAERVHNENPTIVVHLDAFGDLPSGKPSRLKPVLQKYANFPPPNTTASPNAGRYELSFGNTGRVSELKRISDIA